MWILSQHGRMIVDASKLSAIEVADQKKMVTGVEPGRPCIPLGYYNSVEACARVVGWIFSSLSDGDISYEMPGRDEVEYAVQHKVKTTSRKVSHGGS